MACQCDFKTAAADTAALDPHKRVRYSTGLVLGVDEFNQEQLYLMERDRLLQRALHGYGTVLGLAVTVRGEDAEQEVVVAPGLAVTPRGEPVCVPRSQCARLADWLASHHADLAGIGSPSLSSPAEPLSIWVVLCRRDCDTDPVPVLGDPCRTAEDLTVPSRITDDFHLAFRLEPPGQQEEDAVRLLGGLLRAVVVSEIPGPAGFLTPQDLAARVRRIAPAGSPPALPTLGDVVRPSPGSPPVSSPPGAELADLHLDPADAAAVLAAAWEAWITEVRPFLAGGAAGCPDGGEACVLLARLELTIDDAASPPRLSGPVTVDEAARPWLLHTRVLQEWLPALGAAAVPALPFGSPPTFSPVHGDLLGLLADDHPQYLLVNPTTRALVANLAAAGFRITGLPPATAAGQAVPFQQAIKVGDAASGDLAGTFPTPRVDALQGHPVALVAPSAAGQVLTWDGAQWIPAALPALPPGQAPDLLDAELVRIINLSWRHGSLANRLNLTHDGARVRGFALAFGTAPGVRALVRRASLHAQSLRVWVRQPEPGTSFFRHLEVPAKVIPAQVVTIASNGRITVTQAAADAEVSAVVLLIDPALADQFVESGSQLTVEARGEFILDREGRAVDAEFTRAELPTGDRRAGAALGIQGGRFESWTTASNLVVNGVDLNRAAVAELTAIAGLGPARAASLVEVRTRMGGFDDPEDLREVPGLPDNLIARVRAALER